MSGGRAPEAIAADVKRMLVLMVGSTSRAPSHELLRLATSVLGELAQLRDRPRDLARVRALVADQMRLASRYIRT